MTIERKLINLQKEIIKLQDEHLELCIEELNELVVYALGHGWRSSRYEKGVLFRSKISKLKEEISQYNYDL